MIVEAQISIKSNRTAVWSAITNIQQAAEVFTSIEKTELLNEPVQGLVGIKWRETRLYYGKPATIEKWITDAIENESFTSRAEMDGFIFLTRMSISENGNQVIVTSTHETRSQGLMAAIKSLPMIFFKTMLKKAILKDLNDLKTTLEKK